MSTDTARDAYLAAIERLEHLAPELEAAMDQFILAEQQVTLLEESAPDDSPIFDELDERAMTALRRLQCSPRGLDPPATPPEDGGGGVIDPNCPDIDF